MSATQVNPEIALVEDHLNQWKEMEEAADVMVCEINKLYRHQNIIVTFFDNRLLNKSRYELLKFHSDALQHFNLHITVHNTSPILSALASLKNPPKSLRFDLAQTYLLLQQQSIPKDQITEFLETQFAALKPCSGRSTRRDVVLYGFGRVGRVLARMLVDKDRADFLRLRAIVVRCRGEDDLEKRASLLRYDSVHGKFNGEIEVDEKQCAIIANGHFIKVINSDNPKEIDYSAHGIENAVLIDNTGVWRDRKGLLQHMRPGISQVILTAPPKNKDIPTVVPGVNCSEIPKDETIFSAASCTTNAICPVLLALSREYGIENGHLETVHSYTNDQNLIDNYHAKARRGRSAALNMVLTETGADSAISGCLPELSGKLTANAIRVPTPDVSLAILMLNLQKETTKDELNNFFFKTSVQSILRRQIGFTTSDELVSSDFVGATQAGVVDGANTIVTGKRVVVYVWYDNEHSYCCQVMRLATKISGVEFQYFPEQARPESFAQTC